MHSRSTPLGFVGAGVCLFGFCIACGWANPAEPPSDALAQSGERQRLDQRLRSPTSSAPPKTKPDVVVYEGTYPGWPWVAKGPDGTLFCVFREGTEHDFSASGRALLCRSRDHGRTWSKPIVVADAPGVDDRNVAITALSSGDLLVVFNTFYNPDESPLPDGGYPASVQTGPHERLIVDYEIRPESKRIAGYFVVFPSDW